MKKAISLLCCAMTWLTVSAWLLVRLWVPLGGRLPGKLLGPAALLLAGLILYLWHRLELTRRLLHPWREGWKCAVLGGAALCLGTCFDLSYAMLQVGGSLIEAPLFRLLCHLGNGLLLAVIVLSCMTGIRGAAGQCSCSRRQLLILFLLANGLTALYLFTSRTVYIWDSAGYWSVARTLAQQPMTPAQLRQVLETTISLDYNYLLAYPISILMRIFGGSRAVFLFGITNLYTLPGLWAMAVLAQGKKWGGVALFGLLPMFTFIGLTGFVDTAAASLGLWAYVYYTRQLDSLPKNVLAGFLLVATFLLRRYFMFFALSFGGAVFLQELWHSRPGHQSSDWKGFWTLFLTCGVCSLFFTYRFFLDKILGTNYADLYQAYELGLKTDFLIFFRYFGLLLPVLLLLALFRFRERDRFMVPALQLPLCFLLFVCVQTHGQQHLLLYLPGFALLAISLLSERCMQLLAAITMALCLIPRPQPANIQAIKYPAVLPSFHFYGQQRDDIEQLLELARFVDSLSAEELHSASVLSSSLEFNVETLNHLYPSLNLPEPAVRTCLYYHGTVDRRDPFNWNTAGADYLIIGDPIQAHLGEENQQVMAILARYVLDHSGPGLAYEPLPETFSVGNGCTVRIYQRVRDWTYQDYRTISDELTALYPNYAQLYQIPDWVVP